VSAPNAHVRKTAYSNRFSAPFYITTFVHGRDPHGRLEESSMSKQFDEEAASKEREARLAAAERKIAAAAEDLKALSSTVSQALGLSVGDRTDAAGGTVETSLSEIPAAQRVSHSSATPSADVAGAADAVSELVRELEEMILTAQAESLGQQCLMV
jgi:hypothetical protein